MQGMLISPLNTNRCTEPDIQNILAQPIKRTFLVILFFFYIMESGFILIQQDSYKEVLLLSWNFFKFSPPVSNNVIANNFILSMSAGVRTRQCVECGFIPDNSSPSIKTKTLISISTSKIQFFLTK